MQAEITLRFFILHSLNNVSVWNINLLKTVKQFCSNEVCALRYRPNTVSLHIGFAWNALPMRCSLHNFLKLHIKFEVGYMITLVIDQLLYYLWGTAVWAYILIFTGLMMPASDGQSQWRERVGNLESAPPLSLSFADSDQKKCVFQLIAKLESHHIIPASCTNSWCYSYEQRKWNINLIITPAYLYTILLITAAVLVVVRVQVGITHILIAYKSVG